MRVVGEILLFKVSSSPNNGKEEGNCFLFWLSVTSCCFDACGAINPNYKRHLCS